MRPAMNLLLLHGSTGGGAPELPLSIDFTGGVINPATDPDWRTTEGPITFGSIAADAILGQTPSTSPVLRIQSATDTHGRLHYLGIRNANQHFDLSLGIRYQVFFRTEANKRRQVYSHIYDEGETFHSNGVLFGSNTDMSSPNDELFLREYLDPPDQLNDIYQGQDPGTGWDVSDFDEQWVMINYEVTPDGTHMKYFERILGGATSPVQTYAITYDLSNAILDAVATRFASYGYANDIRLVRLWIGTSADAWPTS